VTEDGRRAALERIAEEVRVCTRCRLHAGRTQAVPGEGHPSTEVVFVGEAPGLNEDRQGRPFVGAAGQFLTELLGSIGWSRDEVFISNVVKCRPPQNRDPEPDEIAACEPFLRRQLEMLDPALVVTLGRHSMGRFMPGARIGQTHGTYRAGEADGPAPGALVFAMYHPAAALHQGSLRETLLDDMGHVPGALLEARRRRGEVAEVATAPDVDGTGTAPEVAVPVETTTPADRTEVAPSAESGGHGPEAPAAETDRPSVGPPAPAPVAGHDSLGVAPADGMVPVAREAVGIAVAPDRAPDSVVVARTGAGTAPGTAPRTDAGTATGTEAEADTLPDLGSETVLAAAGGSSDPADDDQMTLFLS
jgi:uracil-DNA glycosylase family 4